MLRWTKMLRRATGFLLISISAFVYSYACAKPGADVSLQGKVERNIASYSQLEERVILNLPPKTLSVEISLKVEGDIQVSSPLLHQKLHYPGSGELHLPLSIQSANDEVAYIGLNIILTDGQGKREARALGLRILVGEALKTKQMQDPQKIKQEKPEEQQIKSYPARETIKQH